MEELKVIDINMDNIDEYGMVCLKNPKNQGYINKKQWLKSRFAEGLRFKGLWGEKEKSLIGFVEYMPGKYSRRAVHAPGYMFVHCIMIYKKQYQGKGYGKQLVDVVINEAKELGMNGVATITSTQSWLADKQVFLDTGFSKIQTYNQYDLLVKTFNKTNQLPKFIDVDENLKKYNKGFWLVYTDQCPLLYKAITDIQKICEERGIKINITKLNSRQDIENSPTIYANFTLIYNGKILSPYYISGTRFKNILDKELKI